MNGSNTREASWLDTSRSCGGIAPRMPWTNTTGWMAAFGIARAAGLDCQLPHVPLTARAVSAEGWIQSLMRTEREEPAGMTIPAICWSKQVAVSDRNENVEPVVDRLHRIGSSATRSRT